MGKVNAMILRGGYIKGIGRASQFEDVYKPAFGCSMMATFNVQTDGPITGTKPTKTMELTWPSEEPKPVNFWLCQINGHWAWAMRWKGTRLPETRLEFISKRRLPNDLKNGSLRIEVFERWPEAKIRDWAAKHYQWQGFDWLSHQRVDSQSVWETIKPHADWPGADVFDVGSHYGYHSFQASKAGAFVVAIEPNDGTRATGEIIASHIEMQDVRFQKSMHPCSHAPDIMFYLSVQHQWDPGYEHLAKKIAGLIKYTKRTLFVEIILPPMFGKVHSCGDVDKMVGGQILKTYKHRIRGVRRIYKVGGKA